MSNSNKAPIPPPNLGHASEPCRCNSAPADLTDSELSREISIAHANCIRSAKDALAHAMRVGYLLIEVKSRCKHGGWLPWLEEQFDGSVRLAQDYMRLAGNRTLIEANTQTSAYLPIAEALRLIADPTPSVRMGKLSDEEQASYERHLETINTSLQRLMACETQGPAIRLAASGLRTTPGAVVAAVSMCLSSEQQLLEPLKRGVELHRVLIQIAMPFLTQIQAS